MKLFPTERLDAALDVRQDALTERATCLLLLGAFDKAVAAVTLGAPAHPSQVLSRVGP